MENTESAPERTHMVSYSWIGTYGNGYGSVDVTLPNGFDGPETRKAIERFLIEDRPDFRGVVILAVIKYGRER